jgi:hypothetical protein
MTAVPRLASKKNHKSVAFAKNNPKKCGTAGFSLYSIPIVLNVMTNSKW